MSREKKKKLISRGEKHNKHANISKKKEKEKRSNGFITTFAERLLVVVPEPPTGLPARLLLSFKDYERH